MADTYTQLLLQFVFTVHRRKNLITEDIRVPLEKYLTGVAQSKGHRLIAIYCMPDHTHILLGLRPHQSISDLARDLKSNSSRWLNDRDDIPFRFEWQAGYGAFTYSNARLQQMINYVLNQPQHHSKQTFKDEYIEMLEDADIDFDLKYIL